MQEIEKQLHLIHSLNKDTAGNKMDIDVNPDLAFARISSVTTGSPADEAVSVISLLSFCNSTINY